VVFPDQRGRAESRGWGGVAVARGVLFIAVAELERSNGQGTRELRSTASFRPQYDGLICETTQDARYPGNFRAERRRSRTYPSVGLPRLTGFEDQELRRLAAAIAGVAVYGPRLRDGRAIVRFGSFCEERCKNSDLADSGAGQAGPR